MKTLTLEEIAKRFSPGPGRLLVFIEPKPVDKFNLNSVQFGKVLLAGPMASHSDFDHGFLVGKIVHFRETENTAFSQRYNLFFVKAKNVITYHDPT